MVGGQGRAAKKLTVFKHSCTLFALQQGMPARAMWKGSIKIGRTELPVKMYSAVVDRGVHFRLLHKPDKNPVKQMMVNPETGDVVEYKDIKRGFVDEGGVVVMLDDEELEQLEPEAGRDIDITRFVPRDTLPHAYYDRPYWLAPDEKNKGSYYALAQALEDEEKIGIARWVMRKKSYVGALVSENGYLMLITLRHSSEVVDASALEAPPGRALEKKERALAEQLVSALEGEFDPTEWKDEYRDQLEDFIKKKAKGRAPKIRRLRAKTETDEESLADVLERSLKKSA